MDAAALSLLCRVGSERVAFAAVDVFKVLANASIHGFPRLPRGILGITHNRGRIVTVADAGAVLLDAPLTSGGTQERVLVLDRGARHLAVRVDAVEGMANVTRGNALEGNRWLRSGQLGAEAILAVDVDGLYDFMLHLS